MNIKKHYNAFFEDLYNGHLTPRAGNHETRNLFKRQETIEGKACFLFP